MKKFKHLLLIISSLSLAIVLSGCSNSAVTQNSTGFWDHYIVWNFIRAIQFLSVNGNYGWGIIFFTIVVRVILLPLFFYQMKSMRKMTDVQPQLKKLQETYSAKDLATQNKLREEQQKLYAEAGVNPVAGCLPLLIQMPILYALYQAIFRSPVLKTGSFLWMHLGDKDPYFILPIVAAIFTFVTSKLSMMSQPEQNGMSTAMTFGMPVVILITAINFPAALSLYWVITNAFSVLQTLLLNNPFKINQERHEKKQRAQKKQRALEKAKRRALKSRKK